MEGLPNCRTRQGEEREAGQEQPTISWQAETYPFSCRRVLLPGQPLALNNRTVWRFFGSVGQRRELWSRRPGGIAISAMAARLIRMERAKGHVM